MTGYFFVKTKNLNMTTLDKIKKDSIGQYKCPSKSVHGNNFRLLSGIPFHLDTDKLVDSPSIPTQMMPITIYSILLCTHTRTRSHIHTQFVIRSFIVPPPKKTYNALSGKIKNNLSFLGIKNILHRRKNIVCN